MAGVSAALTRLRDLHAPPSGASVPSNSAIIPRPSGPGYAWRVRARPPASASKLSRLAGSVHGVVTGDPVFGLTFDDGPDRANTPEILRILDDRAVRATFFVLVHRARKLRGMVTDMVASGHEIALHGDELVDLSKSSPRKVIAEIHRARNHLEELIGRKVRLFRPPYGTQSILSYAVARAAGLQVVGWSASPRDFLTLELDRQVSVALEELVPGGIVLLHDGWPSAPERRRELVGRLLGEADRGGFKPLTVGELLARGEAIRPLWFRRWAKALIEEMAPFQLRQAQP